MTSKYDRLKTHTETRKRIRRWRYFNFMDNHPNPGWGVNSYWITYWNRPPSRRTSQYLTEAQREFREIEQY